MKANGVEEERQGEASRRSVGKGVEIKRRGSALGFDAVGIASLEVNAHADAFDRWLAAGYAGSMTYLHRQADKRKNPQHIMAGARVAIVTLTNYFHGTGHGPGANEADLLPNGRVAQYAQSSDYHEVLGRRLEVLAQAVRELVPGARTRCYVDAGPVPERELAQRAGLGWIGKNMMLIRPAMGSFTFIGVVLTDADLEPDLPFEADRCGTCTRCLDACPTDAFVEPGVLDARRCISYLTIEHRGEFTPDQTGLTGEWLFGCDVCQDVCPWNERFATPTTDPEFTAHPAVAAPAAGLFSDLSDADFERRFGNTPFERPGLAGMRRNAAALWRAPGRGSGDGTRA